MPFVRLAAAASLLALSACGHEDPATAANFTLAVNSYLQQHGDLCLAKTEWPIDVTPHEVQIGDRNAVQMPVLERLGLVTSTLANGEIRAEGERVAVVVKRYVLTDAGRKNIVVRHAVRGGAPGRAVTAQTGSDFCAARLRLDKVVSWQVKPIADGTQEAIVSYTYKVDAAPWTRDPEVARVFPVVARVAAGAGSAQLQEAFRLTPAGWVAEDL